MAAGAQGCWCPCPFCLLSTRPFLSLGLKLGCCMGLAKSEGFTWPSQPPALAPGPCPRVCMTAVRHCCGPPLMPAMPMSALCPSRPAVPAISASEWGAGRVGWYWVEGRPLPVLGGSSSRGPLSLMIPGPNRYVSQSFEILICVGGTDLPHSAEAQKWGLTPSGSHKSGAMLRLEPRFPASSLGCLPWLPSPAVWRGRVP